MRGRSIIISHPKQPPPLSSSHPLSLTNNRAINTPPEVGYSPQAISARRAVLEGALETLVAAGRRREYDERLTLGEIDEDVPADYVAGTLILLQEAGDWQTVIVSGEAWIAQHRRHRNVKDIALAISLAHCETAKALLDAHGDVRQSYAMFEVAGKLLKTHRAGGAELQRSIDEALAALRPRLAVEMLSPENTAVTRARGMEMVPAALVYVDTCEKESQTTKGQQQYYVGGGAATVPSSSPRSQFLARLRDVLSAEEQISVYDSNGALYASSPAELYNVAMACIAVGAATADVAPLKRATQLLAQADHDAIVEAKQDAEAGEEGSLGPQQLAMKARRATDAGHRRAVATCVAWLLLGEGGKAGDALGLRDGKVTCDRQVLHFIRSNSPDQRHLLAGVCALVQRWVADVALTSFRFTFISSQLVFTNESFTLDAWFECDKVLRGLEGRGRGGGVGGGVMAVLTAPFRALASVFLSEGDMVKHEEASEQEVEVRSEQEEEEHVAAAVMAAAARPSMPQLTPPPPPPSSHTTQQQQQQQEALSFSAPTPTPTPTAATATTTTTTATSPFDTTTYNDAYEEEEDDDEDNVFATFGKEPIEIEAIKPLLGEDDWMRGAYETKNIRWGRVAGAGSVLACIGLFAARSYIFSSSFLSPLLAPTARYQQPPSVLTAASTTAAPTITRGEASSLVSRWQKIKAKALGPDHCLADLSSVLSGDLLRQWRERAEALQSNGWHYTHQLYTSKIESVVAVGGGAGPGAQVTAFFKEGVTVHKPGGVEPQTFVSEYRVVYETGLNSNGQWVLVSAAVVQP